MAAIGTIFPVAGLCCLIATVPGVNDSTGEDQEEETLKIRPISFHNSFEHLILSQISGVDRCSQKPSIEFVSQCQGAIVILAFSKRDILKMWCQ